MACFKVGLVEPRFILWESSPLFVCVLKNVVSVVTRFYYCFFHLTDNCNAFFFSYVDSHSVSAVRYRCRLPYCCLSLAYVLLYYTEQGLAHSAASGNISACFCIVRTVRRQPSWPVAPSERGRIKEVPSPLDSEALFSSGWILKLLPVQT